VRQRATPRAVPPGRTVWAREAEILAWHRTAGCSNGPTEAINLLIKKVKRVGHGFPTKGYGSSWIFEPRLTSANALRRVQQRAFSLVTSPIAAAAAVALRRQVADSPDRKTAKPPTTPSSLSALNAG
jgi:hypothetical protein